MSSSEPDFDPDALISRTIRFLERKKEDYVKEVIEETEEAPHTNPNYADIDVYIGSNEYYHTIRDAVRESGIEVDSYENLSYQNFLGVMIRHYLKQRLGDSDISLWTESNSAYYPMPYLIKNLDEKGVEWMKNGDETVRGRGGRRGVWMYFFPEEEVESLVRKIKLDIADRHSCPKEFREALSDFPKVMNQHANISSTDWNRFHATLNHEFTHNYLHRNSTAKSLGLEFIDSLDEATSQFIGKYVHMKRKANKRSALNFHSSPDSYDSYDNPEEIHYFVEIIRENAEYKRKNEARVNIIDHVRQNTLRFMQDKGEEEDFLKQLTPQDFRIPIHRLERADEGISQRLGRMKEDLHYIQRNIRNEPESMQEEFKEIKQDFSEIKSPRQIKKEVLEQAYSKMIDEKEDYEFIGEFIEKELKKELEEFLDSQKHIKRMERILGQNSRIEEQLERLQDLNKQIEHAEDDFKSILEDLERRTT